MRQNSIHPRAEGYFLPQSNFFKVRSSDEKTSQRFTFHPRHAATLNLLFIFSEPLESNKIKPRAKTIVVAMLKCYDDLPF